jgi:hypothetical protein
MMTQDQYDRLYKLFGMLSSESNGEVLNAVAAISRILNVHGLTWQEMLLPRKLVPARVVSDDALDPQGDGPRHPPLGQATVEQMYTALMEAPNVSIDTKRDIRDYAAAVKAKSVTPKVRADIQAMYAYAVLNNKPL